MKTKILADFQICISVLLKNKLKETPEPEIKYNEVIREYLDKGYSVKLSNSEAREQTKIFNYIPHHCVLHPKNSIMYALFLMHLPNMKVKLIIKISQVVKM